MVPSRPKTMRVLWKGLSVVDIAEMTDRALLGAVAVMAAPTPLELELAERLQEALREIELSKAARPEHVARRRFAQHLEAARTTRHQPRFIGIDCGFHA